MPGMRIQALVVEQKDAPFVEQELDLEEPAAVKHWCASLPPAYVTRTRSPATATCRCHSRLCSVTRAPASSQRSARA